MAGSNLDIRWGLLQAGTPHIEFRYPADTPSDIIRIYHGIQHNVPNRRMTKTTLRTKSAGNEYNFRNVGHSTELMRVDVVLATKAEARSFTDFFKYIVKGSSGVFYYKNNFNGQEAYVRIVGNQLGMGEAEGAPYSYSLLLKKEAPYVTRRTILQWQVIQTISVLTIISGASGTYSILLYPSDSKTLWGTGDNNPGQLGLGDYLDRERFEQAGVDTDWADGGGGSEQVLLLKENNDLYTCGGNTYGQLGLGDTFKRNTFSKVGSDTWVKVAGGNNTSYGIKSDGTLWGWGQNNMGQLGQGSYDFGAHSSPLQIGSDTDWIAVAGGTNFVIAQKSDGTLWGCGWDAFGQLGQGATQTRRTSLVQIGTDVDWTTFSCGYAHVLALKDNDDLYAWGGNNAGELGDGTTTDVYTPKKIGTDSWKVISASGGGPGYSVAIKADGTLYSWGYNANYELGIGSSDSNPHSSPIQINSDTDWISVSSGWAHSIAIKGSEIWGWGWNGRGEVGTGFDPVTVPTQTFLPSNATSLVWKIEFGIPPPP